MADTFDDSGLMPGSAEWTLTPDQGMEAPGIVIPTFGGDVGYTTAYPSQEPRQAIPWPRDGVFTGPITDTGQG